MKEFIERGRERERERERDTVGWASRKGNKWGRFAVEETRMHTLARMSARFCFHVSLFRTQVWSAVPSVLMPHDQDPVLRARGPVRADSLSLRRVSSRTSTPAALWIAPGSGPTPLGWGSLPPATTKSWKRSRSAPLWGCLCLAHANRRPPTWTPPPRATLGCWRV